MKAHLIKHLVKLLACLSISAMMAVTAGCHSSKKTVRGSSGVPVRKIDYGEMRDELKSRHYDVPQIGALIAEASRWVGVPYKYAGNDKRGVDCSGLTSQVFLKTLNVKLPRSSREQQQWCSNIKKENLQPGDLVFFATGSNRSRVSHVGIYVGNGEMIHASSSRGVIISNLGETYYNSRYHSSGRPDIIGRIYADAGKKSKKKDGKRSDKQEISGGTEIQPTPSMSGAMTISVDDFIEMQVDSIADAINNPTVLEEKPRVQVPHQVMTPAPAVTIEEPADSVFNQFFD